MRVLRSPCPNWKVVLKRLTDTIIMATRYHLVRSPLLSGDGLREAIVTAFDAHAGRGLELASPSRSHVAIFEDLLARKERLKQAKEKINDALRSAALE